MSTLIMNNIELVYWNRNDVSEGIDINKITASKECNIFHYCYFLNKFFFKFQPNFCNRCNDLLMMSMKFSDIASLDIKSADYCCIISWITKHDAINLMQNANLTEKSRTL